jgi:transposase
MCPHGGEVDTSGQGLVKRGSQRQRHALEEKRRIVEETLEPGASVARVARAHGVNANQVFAWRRQYRQGLLESANGVAGLLPVQVVEAGERTGGPRSARSGRSAAGLIQLELPKGHLRIVGRVDVEALRVVLEQLLG